MGALGTPVSPLHGVMSGPTAGLCRHDVTVMSLHRDVTDVTMPHCHCVTAPGLDIVVPCGSWEALNTGSGGSTRCTGSTGTHCGLQGLPAPSPWQRRLPAREVHAGRRALPLVKSYSAPSDWPARSAFCTPAPLAASFSAHRRCSLLDVTGGAANGAERGAGLRAPVLRGVAGLAHPRGGGATPPQSARGGGAGRTWAGRGHTWGAGSVRRRRRWRWRAGCGGAAAERGLSCCCARRPVSTGAGPGRGGAGRWVRAVRAVRAGRGWAQGAGSGDRPRGAALRRCATPRRFGSVRGGSERR